jgi:RNA polymerase-binding transcription factor DksA
LPEHDEAFRDEVADDLEELGEREEVELGLEKRLRQVRAALARLEAGTYGKCEVGGEEIEAERLEVNPAARTCKAHLEEEGTLV